MNTTEPAIFSTDRKYRYLLRRRVSFGDDICLFIMLNPSTADEEINDPTIRRCMGFASAWGYGVLEVVNLFALRATNPRHLCEPFTGLPVGPDNDWHISEAAQRAHQVVAAWGNWGALHGRSISVLRSLLQEGIKVTSLGFTNHQEPKHPLYVPADTLLVNVVQ